MAYGVDKRTENFVGDPAGYLTGTNKEGAAGVKKMLFGDPEAIKAAYDAMMGTAKEMTGETRKFLGDKQQQALSYFAPMQRMFQNAYGTGGLIPQGQGVRPFGQMYGGG